MTVFFTTHYMEEAARTADEIAIMDHGQIMKTGTAKSLIEETGTTNLEDAFLKLTGNALRDEDATAKDHMRSAARMWRGGTRR